MRALPYDLANPNDVSRLRTDIERWLNEDKAVQEKYWAEWNEIDQRLNTDYKPVGYSTTFALNLAQKNDPTQGKQIIKEFVQVPRTRPNHESKLGDFLAQRRRLSITGRKPSGRNRAKVFHSMIEYIEDSEMIPEVVYAPALDNGISKGLHWIKLGFNPRANGLRGRFEASEVGCRDVMVGASTRGWYFKTMDRISMRKQFKIDEAKRKFQKYPLFNSQNIGSDREYDEPYENTENTNDDVCTIYEIQFKRTVNTYYQVVATDGAPATVQTGNPQTGQRIVEISEQDYLTSIRNNPNDPSVFYEEEERYFVCLYNRSVGPFHLLENEFKMWTLIPMGNIFTDQRVYPMGDVWIYKNLQDLLDVLVTVFLENAKRSNIPIATSKSPEAYSEYKAAIDSALRHGGFAPGVDQLFYPQSINAALASLIPWVIGWIQDTASRHGASMGELPSRQIAKETVQTLIAKDRQAHGRTDIMIKYALTKFAKLMVSYIAAFCKEPDFIDVLDSKPNSPTHIPINQTWTEDEYVANLANMYSVPHPSTPEEDERFNSTMKDVRARFELDNDAQMANVPGYTVGNRKFTQEHLAEKARAEGLSAEDFTVKYAPVPATVGTYKVNHLIADDPDLNVMYEIDSDYKNDPEYRANLGLMLNARKAITNLDMLKMLDISNAEELDKNARSENQMIQLATEISSDPNLMAAVQAILSKQRNGVAQ